MTRRRVVVKRILDRARFLAKHALDLHTLTAEQEHQPHGNGFPLRGAALCATYLRVAQEVAAELEFLDQRDREAAAHRRALLERRFAKALATARARLDKFRPSALPPRKRTA